ncbi:MAG: 50S ribosomal protein L13 [Candidatus Coatesbacteria bacterium]|mgnify:CR=1 FL=1
MSRQTTYLKVGEAQKRWVVVDAEGQVLGRLATHVATLLRGKNRAKYTPHVNAGDVVIVVNADKIRLTGDKLNQKFLKHYTGYPGGLKEVPYSKVMALHPEKALRRAVWGMVPHGRMGRAVLRSLKIYVGPDHPHVAQQPVRDEGAKKS